MLYRKFSVSSEYLKYNSIRNKIFCLILWKRCVYLATFALESAHCEECEALMGGRHLLAPSVHVV